MMNRANDLSPTTLPAFSDEDRLISLTLCGHDCKIRGFFN